MFHITAPVRFRADFWRKKRDASLTHGWNISQLHSSSFFVCLFLCLFLSLFVVVNQCKSYVRPDTKRTVNFTWSYKMSVQYVQLCLTPVKQLFVDNNAESCSLIFQYMYTYIIHPIKSSRYIKLMYDQVVFNIYVQFGVGFWSHCEKQGNVLLWWLWMRDHVL